MFVVVPVVIFETGATGIELLFTLVGMFSKGFTEILDIVVVGVSDASASYHASPLNPVVWFVGGIDV